MLIRTDTGIASSASSVLPTSLSTSVVTDLALLASLQSEWLELLARSTANEAMLTPWWLLTWWEVFGGQDQRRLRVLLFRAGPRLVGLAPLLARRYWYPPGIPFRRLEPLGTGERERDSICSDYLNIIAEQGFERQVANALATAVTSGVLGPWDELVLPMMDGNGPMPSLLVAAFQDAGVPAEVVQTGGAPFISLPANWDHYLLALDKKNRYHIHLVHRHFTEWAGSDWRVNRVSSPEELPHGQQILIALHQERWRGVAQAGVFRSPFFLRFHDLVMQRLLGQGALELRWLSVRGVPVAATYSIVWNGKVSYYQCGRKMDLPPQVRPGSFLLHDGIRTALAQERREFDFLNGMERYKLQLALGVRPLLRFRATRPAFVEQLRRLARQGWQLAKAVRAACHRPAAAGG